MNTKWALIKIKKCVAVFLLLTTGTASAYTQHDVDQAADMGVRYLFGRGVVQSDKHAFYYFDQAAQMNDPFAENELGFMYAAGRGVDKNATEAFSYYKKAANHGLSSAEYNLGLLYLTGFGTEKNKNVAKAWIKRAASHGFLPAIETLKTLS